MPRCHLALGGNVGDVQLAFQTALAGLTSHNSVRVTQVSSTCRTQPVGPRSGGEFLNAAAEIETSLEALQLLDILQELERSAGREHGKHWAPRPLDLDLIFYADRVIEHPRLTVPHPACWYRRFVLDPLAEIAAEVLHPVKGITIGELRARLLVRPLRLALAGSSGGNLERLRQELASISDELQVVDWSLRNARDPEPAILAWLGSHPETSSRVVFDALPVVPRLDVSRVSDPAVFLRGVVQSALG